MRTIVDGSFGVGTVSEPAFGPSRSPQYLINCGHLVDTHARFCKPRICGYF